MNPGQASQAVLIVILVSIWTGLMMLARAHTNVPLREQRIALALCVAVTAALLAWGVVWSRPQPQPSDLAPIWASARALSAPVRIPMRPWDQAGRSTPPSRRSIR